MKVLIVGSGAREHAIVRALMRDENVTGIECAPGNAGSAGDVTTLPLDVTDTQAIAALALERGIDLVVIGPEAPLVAGAADAVRAAGIACFGPSARAAQLEGSKAFAKEFMRRHNIPTAGYGSFDGTQVDEAVAFLDTMKPPYVMKADGLAAGKGVIITEDLDEGPIIEQDVVRVGHSHSKEDLVRLGKDVEKLVLARALRNHLENRVIVQGRKTLVFE